MTRIFDVKGAKTFLSLSERLIREHLPEIPHFTSPGGGKFLFREDELLQWLERYRVKPVDLGEAFKVAEGLTRDAGRKKNIRKKEVI